MFRVATFNIENLDNTADDKNPSIEVRAPVLRAALNRLNADIICLQEVHGQELPDHTASHPRRNLAALDYVLSGTQYADFHRAFTVTSDKVPYNLRNLVILSRYEIQTVEQYRNDHVQKLQYRKLTAVPAETETKDLGWERPILYAKVDVPTLGPLHILNLHLKSRLSTTISGQMDNAYTWRSAAGWAEGYFLSSVKRVGQALEARVLVDKLFDAEADARILVCGDFNSEPGEVPVEAICGRVENTNNPALRARVLTPCSRAIPESVRFSLYHQGRGNLLDHILISKALIGNFQGAEIHNETLHDESLPFTYDTLFPESDHAPFVSTFL